MANSAAEAATAAEATTTAAAAYTRLRVRFTCDEDIAPWCKEKGKEKEKVDDVELKDRLGGTFATSASISEKMKTS